MNLIRNAIVASAMVLASAVPSFAVDGSEPDGTRMIYINSAGTMSYINATAAGKSMLMKYAKPVNAGTIFLRHNGKLYMVQDQKMADGRMLFEAMRDRGAYNS